MQAVDSHLSGRRRLALAYIDIEWPDWQAENTFNYHETTV